MPSTESNSVHELLKTSLLNGRTDVLQTLMSELGANNELHNVIDSICTDDGTLLHTATKRGDVDSARALLSRGANPCIPDSQGKYPFYIAQSSAMKQVFEQELLQAVAQSKLGRICQLLSSGVSLDLVDSISTMNTPLHWAATYSSDDIIKVLCEGGSVVNARNSLGETPLHDAVRRGNSKVVLKLLEYGGDPTIKNLKGEDCFATVPSKYADVIQILNSHSVAQQAFNASSNNSGSLPRPTSHKRTSSITSVDSVQSSSVVSINNASMRNQLSLSPPQSNTGSGGFLMNGSAMPASFIGHWSMVSNEELERAWCDTLWPPPKHVTLFGDHKKTFQLDKVIQIYLGDSVLLSDNARLAVIQFWQLYLPYLTRLGIKSEFVFEKLVDKLADASFVVLEICNALFPINELSLNESESYEMRIESNEIKIIAANVRSLKNAIVTLIQVLSNCAFEKSVPACVLKDSPSTCYRGVLIDVSGWRQFTADTLCRIILTHASAKANVLFLDFILGASGSLPYNRKDLFDIEQCCKSVGVFLCPSFDVEKPRFNKLTIDNIIGSITSALDIFPVGYPILRIGPVLTKLILENIHFRSIISRLSKLIFFACDCDHYNCEAESFSVCTNEGHNSECYRQIFSKIRDLPSHFVPMIGCDLVTNEKELQSFAQYSMHKICISFNASDRGYFCPSPDNVIKVGIVSSRLVDKLQSSLLAVCVCDWSNPNHLTWQSFAFLKEWAILGASWNASIDMRKYASLFVDIIAEHAFLEPKLARLIQKMMHIGKIEHDFTKFVSTAASGLKMQSSNVSERRQSQTTSASQSILLQLLLDSDQIPLEYFSPIAFKKARIEFGKCLKTLNSLKTDLPYNFDIAVTLSEVQLTCELMMVACRIGQSLCLTGSNPSSHTSNAGVTTTNSLLAIGAQIVNPGLANLSLTTKTDLANKLLELRAIMQHTWLSRHLLGTLPAALSTLDKAVNALLPSSLEQYKQEWG